MKTSKVFLTVAMSLVLMIGLSVHADGHHRHRHGHNYGGYYPCGGANGPCGNPYPCGGANGPCGNEVIVRQRVVIVPPFFVSTPLVEQRTIVVPRYVGEPQYVVPQGQPHAGAGPRLVQPPPQQRLRQVNVDTATLMKKAKVIHHTYGKPPYPDDLRPGEAVVICNAESGPYRLDSESQYKGKSYHKQQCWRYDNPLDGPPVEEEIFVN